MLVELERIRALIRQIPAESPVGIEARARTMASRYAAFLSYGHAADRALAAALQRSLQRIGKPWYRRPTLMIFRDETSLSADPGLWTSIERNLAQSDYLILLASPAAAQSAW